MALTPNIAQRDLTPLKFSIFRFSSYSSSYVPDNIRINRPSDQSSRWSSDTTDSPQYLVLKLEHLAITQTITFGKFEKSHVCNLKKFKVYGAVDDANYTELLEAGLKNDSEPETFLLKHTIEGNTFPSRFIKIVPLVPYGSSFNFSIWFVELKGITSLEIVESSALWLASHREREVVRLCLKHFRKQNYHVAFEALQSQTRVCLEHPLLSRLYQLLVHNADFEGAEKAVTDDSEAGLFESYVNGQECYPVWSPINPPPDLGAELRPGMRGGHQMCMDVQTEIIYLFGGWDGSQDLADFWSFHVPTKRWTLISSNTAEEGGPSPRSCHKMVLDQERRQIFTLGRYVDSSMRTPNNLKSDFYLYDLDSNQWTMITDDTYAMGGPRLVFDHQMCIDVAKRILYIFGGRVLTSNPSVSDMPMEEGSVLDRPLTSLDVPLTALDVQTAMSALEWSTAVSTIATSAAPWRAPVMITPVMPSPVMPSPPPRLVSGRIEYLFSGLYSYHVPTNTWTLLHEDSGAPNASSSPNDSGLRSRIGHSMLFHPVKRKLFIFAGQRSKEYLDDFLTYDVDNDRIDVVGEADHDSRFSSGDLSSSVANKDVELPSAGDQVNIPGSAPFSKGHLAFTSGGLKDVSAKSASGRVALPAAGFTQRATIDPDLDEIHVLSGLSKDKDKREENVKNSFWVYSIPANRWSCVYKNENQSLQYWEKMVDREPCPRFAHQLVFDHIRKVHYLFGGNTGKASLPKMRLDDFWALRLVRPTKSEVLRKCIFLIRKFKYLEMVASGLSMEAAAYLQTAVSAVVDHESEGEKKEFHSLASYLFGVGDDHYPGCMASSGIQTSPAVSPTFPLPMDSYLGDDSSSSEADTTAINHPVIDHTVDPRRSEVELSLGNIDQHRRRRSQLFDLLVSFYPDNMTQPTQNLSELIAL